MPDSNADAGSNQQKRRFNPTYDFLVLAWKATPVRLDIGVKNYGNDIMNILSVAQASELTAESSVNPQATTFCDGTWLCEPLFLTEVLLLLLVLLAAPCYASYISNSEKSEKLTSLNLPKGSVRAMLALLIVASFVNVLVFGANVMGENFEQVVTAFGTLAGAVTGFYFAGKGSDQSPPQPDSTDTPNQTRASSEKEGAKTPSG